MKIIRHLLFLSVLLVQAQLVHAGNFVVDKSQSELAADMHASPSHDFTSVAQDFSCDIEIDPQTLAIRKAVCRFKFDDLDSEKGSRDKKMRKWIDTEKYPAAEYTMQSIRPAEGAGHYIATGTFKMVGIERPLEIDFQVERQGEKIVLSGSTELDHRQWGLKKVRLLFFTVNPLLKPHFKLVGHLASANN